MSGKQHKREEKARRRAAREKAKREERRRNLMTGIVVVVILALGGVLIAVSIGSDDVTDLAELPTDIASIEPSVAPTPTEPGEVVPNDPSVEPGTAVDSGLPAMADGRPVACDAEEPANVTDSRPQFPGGPADVLTDGTDYAVTIETSCGTVTVDLLEDAAPEAVNSFVFLTQQGFFDGLEIFRNATTISALQTGGGDNGNTWDIGYSLPDELTLAQTEGYPTGSVAMANSGPNSAGSQFFFVYDESFDVAFEGAETFTVFGQVTEGLDVLQQIGAIPMLDTDPERPEARVYMNTVTVDG